jgi:hypothetical protein
MTTPLNDIYYPVKNGTIEYAPTQDIVLQYRFPNTTFSQGFISKDHINTRGETVKQYLTISDFPSWLHEDIVGGRKDHHLYELIPTGSPVRPYFDIEYDGYSVNGTAISDCEIIDAFFNALTACFALLGVEVKPEDTTIFDASGACSTTKIKSGFKSSFHIILGDCAVFRSTLEHKSFIDNVLLPYIKADEGLDKMFHWWDAKDVRKCAIDNAPYGSNQSFRLPYQSKLGSNRPFVPATKTVTHYCIGLYCDPATLKFISLPVTVPTEVNQIVIPRQFRQVESPEFALVAALTAMLSVEFLSDYMSTRNLIWYLWTVEQTERMSALIHAVCERGRNYSRRWVCDIISGWRYGAINIGSLIKWTMDSGATGDALKTILKQHKVNYNQELFTCHMTPQKHTILERRYLESSVSFTEDINTIIIKSHLGTGKTVAISEIIHGLNSNNRILIISPRKSYTYSQQGSLPDFTSYLDNPFGDLAHVSRLIIQVESLHRIGAGFKKYDLVILDEIESILNQLHSVKTNAGNLICNHEVLGLAVSTASKVIAADAFISDRTFNFSSCLRSAVATHYFENTFNPYKRMAVLLPSVERDTRVANIGGFCERICEALRAGRKIVVLWTSKRRGDWFVKNFLSGSDSAAYSWIFYNSASSKEDQAGLRNVNDTWKEVQCLMMTTSITVGISYDPKIADVEFDEAFLYGSSASAMPRDIAQALFRVRSLKANKLTYVLDTRASYGGSELRGFSNIWNELAKKENKLIRGHPVVKWTTCPDWARYNFCYCENEERNSRAEYKAVLEEYLVRSGYSLVEEVHIPSEKVAAIEVSVENKEAIMWGNIDIIGDTTADDIYRAMKCGDATEEDMLCWKKWRFIGEFRCGCDELVLKELWERFYEGGCEGRFWNVVMEKRWSVDDVARAEALKRYGCMAGDAIVKREVLGKFLKIVGMRHSQEAIVIGAERLEEIGVELVKVEREVREGLGLRASRSKGKEWKVANTIDFVTAVLEGWGCGKVESVVKKKKVNKETIREYSLKINQNNIFWDNILNSNIDYNENLIRI